MKLNIDKATYAMPNVGEVIFANPRRSAFEVPNSSDLDYRAAVILLKAVLLALVDYVGTHD